MRLFKIYVLVTNGEEDAVTDNASFLPRDSFTSAYFSVHYSLYKQRNLIHIFLLSVFLLKENIEGNLTHVIFQVDNDTEVDVYRAKGLHGKIYEVSNC